MTVSELVDALAAEFAGSSVGFAATPPKTFDAPSVVVTPGEPFLEVHAGGARPETVRIKERWEVLVVVSMKDTGAGIDQMRQNSLRVMRAVSRPGSVWTGASPPQKVTAAQPDREYAAATNQVHFVYEASTQLPEESS